MRPITFMALVFGTLAALFMISTHYLFSQPSFMPIEVYSEQLILDLQNYYFNSTCTGPQINSGGCPGPISEDFR